MENTNLYLEFFLPIGPSAPPQNLAVNAAGPNNLSVTWLHPPAIDTNGKLTRYNITYREANSSAGSELLLEVLGSSLSAELSGLKNFTEYTVTVAAHTMVGEGPPAVMNGTTAENGIIALHYIAL